MVLDVREVLAKEVGVVKIFARIALLSSVVGTETWKPCSFVSRVMNSLVVVVGSKKNG